jgi:hypothetical protein
MFKCEKSGMYSQPNEKACKLVTHVRSKTYHKWDHKEGQEVVIGFGTEIVREVLVSKEYYSHVMAKGFQPQVVVEKE